MLGTRFGTVWRLGLLAWLAVGAVVLWRRPAPVPVLRSASVGATGLALPRARAGLVTLAVPLGALALLPALSGHAGTEQPAWLWLPGNIVHVVAASAWIGGLVALVVALRAATRALEPADRTRLLAAVVGRFSALAAIAVAALLATGVLQGLLAVGAVHELWDTAYGRAVLVKLAAFVGLVVLGAVNRQRLLPRLRRAAQGREAPGAAGGALRRTLRAEVLLGLARSGRRARSPARSRPRASRPARSPATRSPGRHAWSSPSTRRAWVPTRCTSTSSTAATGASSTCPRSRSRPPCRVAGSLRSPSCSSARARGTRSSRARRSGSPARGGSPSTCGSRSSTSTAPVFTVPVR